MTTDTTGLARRQELDALSLADPEQVSGALEHVLGTGDIGRLSNAQRVGFILEMCRRADLNPLERPFEFIKFPDGKVVAYPSKNCAEQLRRRFQISIKIIRREVIDGFYVVVAEGRMANGRTDESSKYVPLTRWDARQSREVKLSGREYADALAKAETGAKRRVTFSMVGFGSLPDLDDIAGARSVVIDGSGRIIEQPTDEERALAENPKLAHALGRPTWTTAASEPIIEPSASFAPTPDELEPPRQPVERATFKPTDEQVEYRLRSWFAAVKGSEYDSDDARHAFVQDWTARYPDHLRTESLREFFSHATDQQAAQLLAFVRDHVQVPVVIGQRSGPARPEHGVTYTPLEARTFYRAWANELARRDTSFRPVSDAALARMTPSQIVRDTFGLIGQVDDIDAALAEAYAHDDDDDEETDDAVAPF